MCLGVFLLGFILPGTFCAFWEVFSYYLFKYFSGPSSSFPSGTPIMQIFMHFMLSSLLVCLHFFSFFFSIFCSVAAISTIPVLQVIYPFSSFSYSAVDSIWWSIHVGLFFSSSRPLVNMSCIFSIFASILFLRPWVIFTIITLNSWKFAYLHLIQLFFWGCILSLHLGRNFPLFHHD